MNQVQRVNNRLAALARNRMVHFAVLGLAMFAIAPRQADPRTVRLGPDQVGAIWASELRTNRAGSLDADERHAVLARFVDDELLYREGVRLGLAEDDRIVRNRVIQKMLFYSENLAGASEAPSDARLRAFYAETPERWQQGVEVRFEQVFVPRALHSDDGERLAHAVREMLVSEPDADAARVAAIIANVGVLDARDSFSSAASLAHDLGVEAARAIVAQLAATWGGVLSSPLGWHVVRVRERHAGALRPFEEVRGELILAYTYAAKDKANRDTLERLRLEYEVEVVAPGGEAIAPEALARGRQGASDAGHVSNRGGE